MPRVPIVTADVLHLAVYGEAAVIVLLLILAGVLFMRLDLTEADRYDAVAERDEQRIMVQTMREMSRAHAETITRIASIKGRKK